MSWQKLTAGTRFRRRARRGFFEPLEPRCLLAAITMADEEQLVVEMINRARANPAAEAARLGIDLNQDLTPGTISTAPKQPLAPHQLLIDVAAAHSQDMIDRDFFDHENPDGDDPSDRLNEAGYPWRLLAENIALDYDAVWAQDALFLSPDHRANMLCETYREVGAGIARQEVSGVSMTELFASRLGNAFLTGVAFSDQSDGNNFFSPGEGLEGVTISAKARSRGTTYTTVTGPTGGYSLQVPADTYDLTASGGELRDPICVSGVFVGTLNVKADFVLPHIVLPPDSFEPNDWLGQASVLTADVRTLSHLSLHEADEEDFFEWQAQANGRFIVELDSSRNVGNLDLFLYDAQGSLIAASQTLDPIERVACDVVTGGRYYFRVAGCQGATHPDYDVTIVGPGDLLPPVADNDRAMTQKDVAIVIDVLGNDMGRVPLDMASVTIVSQPSSGQVFADQATGRVYYAPSPGQIGPDGFSYQVRDVYGLWSSAVNVFVAVVDVNDRPWRNPVRPQDVNADELVSAIDALILINDVNVNQARALPPPAPDGTFPVPYLDVTGDGQVCSQDVLEVVNSLNASAAAGEGESPSVDQTECQPPVAYAVLSHLPPRAVDNQQERWKSESAAVPVGKPGLPQGREALRDASNSASGGDGHRRLFPAGNKTADQADGWLLPGELLAAIDGIAVR